MYMSILNLTGVDRKPVSLFLVLDYSGSLSAYMADVVSGAHQLIELLEDIDEASVCKFRASYESYGILEKTDAEGKDNLYDYLDDRISSSIEDGSAIYDTAYYSVGELINYAEEGNNLVVIILSDGMNHDGSIVKEQVVDLAASGNRKVSIITIYFPGSESLQAVGIENLSYLATNTNGFDYYAEDGDLDSIFEEIAYVISNKYTITYDTSSATGRSVVLEVSVQTDDGPKGKDKITANY